MTMKYIDASYDSVWNSVSILNRFFTKQRIVTSFRDSLNVCNFCPIDLKLFTSNHKSE